MRKFYLIEPEKGALCEKVPGAINPMTNPMGMMENMKGQTFFYVTQMMMMQVWFGSVVWCLINASHEGLIW